MARDVNDDSSPPPSTAPDTNYAGTDRIVEALRTGEDRLNLLNVMSLSGNKIDDFKQAIDVMASRTNARPSGLIEVESKETKSFAAESADGPAQKADKVDDLRRSLIDFITPSLIEDLDSPHFAAREKASQVMRNMGALAFPIVDRIFQGKPSLELGRRAENILRGRLGQYVGESPINKFLDSIENYVHLDVGTLTSALGESKKIDAGSAGEREIRQLMTILKGQSCPFSESEKNLMVGQLEVKLSGKDAIEAISKRLDGIRMLTGHASTTPKEFAEAARYLKNVKDIYLLGAPVTDEHLRQFAINPNLQSVQILAINGKEVSDKGLEHLRSAESLTSLTVSDMKLNAKAVKEMMSWRGLRSLELRNCEFPGGKEGAEALEMLAKNEGLGSLKIMNCKFDNNAPLDRLKNLTSLSLDGKQLSDDNLKKLKDLPNLNSLDLNFPAKGLDDSPGITMGGLSKHLNKNLIQLGLGEKTFNERETFQLIQLLQRNNLPNLHSVNIYAFQNLLSLEKNVPCKVYRNSGLR